MRATATRSPLRPARRAGPQFRRRRRRRTLLTRRRVLWAAGFAAAAAALAISLGPLGDAVRELTLPLRHDDIIRQQAREKHLDPALIAAIIYHESKFRDRTSHAGAKGLMQILPGTAKFIARKSGGTTFELDDLANPQVNISYGAWYLRYLMRRYDRKEVLAVAAYNAGERNVDRWVRKAGGPGSFDAEKDIPFPETREYVRGVMNHRDDYRHRYGNQLGL